jgi:hypothetical protein
MARNRSVSPPPDLVEDGKVIWRAAVRQLQEQGTWRAVDGPLLESYVQLVLSARAARRAGQHDTAAESEDRAAARAAALMLTPETRRFAPNGKPRSAHAPGRIESSTSVSGVA